MMNAQVKRSDAKIRQRFVIYSKPTRREIGRRLAEGHIYEQRNVMLTSRNGQACSIQYASIDVVLQSIPGIYQIEFID